MDVRQGAGAGNQTFKYIGAQNFTHTPGELQAKYNAQKDIGIVSADVDGDAKADFQITVHSASALVKADFFL